MDRTAKAPITPVRQRSQYTCMASSLSMCLKALGQDMDEDTVNSVMGASPLRGASWEQAIAAAQYFGMRATMVSPCTLGQIRAWTDAGVPVMIAWNPEGRPWSHASVVFDVTDTDVHVADPNIPDPTQTVRVVPHTEFFSKWGEKWEQYIVRRPAMAIEREITPDGKQVRMASTTRTGAAVLDAQDTLHIDANMALEIQHKFKDSLLKGTPRGGFTLFLDNPESRKPGAGYDDVVQYYFVPDPQTPGGFKTRLTRSDIYGDTKATLLREFGWVGVRVTRQAGYSGNPDNKDIYPNQVDHGYGEPLGGGTDVMRRLQNQLLQEQGQPQRPESPRLARALSTVWVVADPTPDSDLEDTMTEIDTAQLASLIVGTGLRTWKAEHTVLHDDEASAKADALRRMQRRAVHQAALLAERTSR